MKKYRRFLRSMFYIGCIGFGGGSALIPIIEQEIAEKQGLDAKQNIDKDVVVASITPGALPVEMRLLEFCLQSRDLAAVLRRPAVFLCWHIICMII